MLTLPPFAGCPSSILQQVAVVIPPKPLSFLELQKVQIIHCHYLLLPELVVDSIVLRGSDHVVMFNRCRVCRLKT